MIHNKLIDNVKKVEVAVNEQQVDKNAKDLQIIKDNIKDVKVIDRWKLNQ